MHRSITKVRHVPIHGTPTGLSRRCATCLMARGSIMSSMHFLMVSVFHGQWSRTHSPPYFLHGVLTITIVGRRPPPLWWEGRIDFSGFTLTLAKFQGFQMIMVGLDPYTCCIREFIIWKCKTYWFQNVTCSEKTQMKSIICDIISGSIQAGKRADSIHISLECGDTFNTNHSYKVISD